VTLKHDRIIVEERITYRHDVYVTHNFSDEEVEKRLSLIDLECRDSSLDVYIHALEKNGFKVEMTIPDDQDSPFDLEMEIVGIEEAGE